MRSLVVVVALMIAVGCSGYAFAESQPLTRPDCAKAGMKWDDVANVCAGGGGGGAAAAAAAPAKEAAKVSEKKVVKKVRTRHGTKKYTYHKKTYRAARAPKKEHTGFFKWLAGKNKKS